MRIGVTPFFNKNKNLLLTKIQRAKVIFPDKVKYNLEYSDEFVDIIEKLLNKNANNRIGSKNDVHEVLSHPWFADLNIEDLEAQKIAPPLKPDVKEGSVDFKYFNLKQQTMADSFMPPEKISRIQNNKHKFVDFDSNPNN
jgi:serine/threonine protein kinase